MGKKANKINLAYSHVNECVREMKLVLLVCDLANVYLCMPTITDLNKKQTKVWRYKEKRQQQ